MASFLSGPSVNLKRFGCVWILMLASWAQASRLLDVSSVPVQLVQSQAGAHVNITCPGVSEHSLVLVLEWRCRGCEPSNLINPVLSTSGSSSSSSSSSHHNNHHHQQQQQQTEFKLVEFASEATTVWHNQERVTLGESYHLEFRPVKSTDSGHYLCLVNNRPRPETVIRLIVQDVPDPPGRPLIMGFTSRSVNLSWAPSFNQHNSPVTHYIIHIRVGEDGEFDVVNGLVTETNKTGYTVVGLQPYMVYSFRVVAVNALGPSEPSRESYYMVTLREVPDGKPSITAAHNSSSTSIYLGWKPPPRSSLHGEFLGYRLAYRPRDEGPESVQEVFLRDPSIESHTLLGLKTFTQFLVSLQVFNPEGLGPSTTVVVMTDEGAPGKPVNLTVGEVTDSSVALSWMEHPERSGILRGYRIYYMTNNHTDVKILKSPSTLEYILTNLEPYTEYKILVRAYTGKNDGDHSDTVMVKTDVRGPSPPRIANLSCQSEDTLILHFQRPATYYHSIDRYFIYYRNELNYDFEEIPVDTKNENLEHMLLIPIPNSTTITPIMFEVKVRGSTKSLLHKDKWYHGNFSDPRKILLTPGCDRLPVFPNGGTQGGQGGFLSDKELSAGVIATVACASFAILLLILALVLWRKYFQAAYYYLDDPSGTPPTTGATPWDGGGGVAVIDSKGEEALGLEGALGYKGPIPVPLFPQHVAALHADGDIGFSKEYEAIQGSAPGTLECTQSLHEDNKAKNRYLNIVAYDHSRVQLRPIPGQKKTGDYINSNFIDGFNQSRAYVAAQGPMPHTFDTHWRMIWEQRVSVIIMITNLIERGRRKCDQYWPKEGTEIYGVVQVRLLQEDVLATYTIRTFSIKHLKVKRSKGSSSERTVVQYHYTNWPDHGVPEHPLPILSFVKKSAAANPPGAGPIVVHCSAGVGRTGTYIVLDAMLRQIRARGELNVRGYLCHIRAQRNFLVQTEEQYVFIHDALLEAIQAGDTNVPRDYLSTYLQTLQSGLPPLQGIHFEEHGPGDGEEDKLTEYAHTLQLLDHQYKLVANFIPQDFHYTSALAEVNHVKNRHPHFAPVETARVHLTPRPGVEGSDYINGSWLQGYNKLREYIITQHPLESTISDFWQMLWDHNVQTVVVLSPLDSQGFPLFWPLDKQDIECDNFRVRLVEETQVPLCRCSVAKCDNTCPDCVETSTCQGNVLTQLQVVAQSLQDDYQLHVRLFYCPLWLHRDSLDRLGRLPELVRKAHIHEGPLVVIDRWGGTEAATFCCLSTVMKQLEQENHADVYQYAKLYHAKRPSVWPTRDDYWFLYRAIEAIAKTLPPYSPPAVALPLSPPSPEPPTLPLPLAVPLSTSLSLPLQLNGHVSNGYGSNTDYLGLSAMSPGGHQMRPTSLPPNGHVIMETGVRIPPDGMETRENTPHV